MSTRQVQQYVPPPVEWPDWEQQGVHRGPPMKNQPHQQHQSQYQCPPHKHELRPLPPIQFPDWNEEEMDRVCQSKLTYTVRSSKYPRCLEDPTRILVIVNDTHRISLNIVLLKAFSTTLASLIASNSTLKYIRINGAAPITSMAAWDIYTTWLYTLDKVPLPDYTPIRRAHWRTRDMVEACLLAGFLGATKFEKYLLRIIFKEVADGRFPERELKVLAEKMPKPTGMWWFANEYFRWKRSGESGELDPYRWRIEHWYSICGRGGNWGCFHAMNTSGWGGVWERQKMLDKEHKVSWMDEVLYDELDIDDPFDLKEDGGEGENSVRLGKYEEGYSDDFSDIEERNDAALSSPAYSDGAYSDEAYSDSLASDSDEERERDYFSPQRSSDSPRTHTSRSRSTTTSSIPRTPESIALLDDDLDGTWETATALNTSLNSTPNLTFSPSVSSRYTSSPASRYTSSPSNFSVEEFDDRDRHAHPPMGMYSKNHVVDLSYTKRGLMLEDAAFGEKTELLGFEGEFEDDADFEMYEYEYGRRR